LVWIDTPGTGPREKDVLEEITDVLRKQTAIEIHLVLSAAMKSADLRMAVEMFAAAEPDKVAFAHLDETENFGGLLSVAYWLKKPISFLSSGQRIPEDLEAATRGKVTSLITSSFTDRRGSIHATPVRGAAAGF
jgi:flagellar biosynthesis protein FlhF